MKPPWKRSRPTNIIDDARVNQGFQDAEQSRKELDERASAAEQVLRTVIERGLDMRLVEVSRSQGVQHDTR